MNASTVALIAFLCFNSVVVLLHTAALHLAEWRLPWQLLAVIDFNGEAHGLFGRDEAADVLVASATTAVGCAIVYMLSTERFALLVTLPAFHLLAFVTSVLDKPGGIKWAGKHAVASFAALLLTFLVAGGRLLYKLYRWRFVMKLSEKVFERLPKPALERRNSQIRPGVDGPILILYANVGSGHKRAAKAHMRP